jgi:hypothetical protein
MKVEITGDRQTRGAIDMGTVHYLAARTHDGSRMTAVEIDANDPWAAFRAMRKQMRRRRMNSPHFAFLETDHRLGHQAKVIDLTTRRAG